MTDETNPALPTTSAPAGWYRDPWSSEHHRYWDGAAWTAGTFPNGPTPPWAGERAPKPEAAATEMAARQWSASPPPPQRGATAVTTAPPPPSWMPAAPPVAETTADLDGGTVELAPAPSRFPTGFSFVALVLGVMLVVGALATLGGYLVFRQKSATTAAGQTPSFVPSAPTTTAPPPAPEGSTDPDASSLTSLVLTQGDVPNTVIVAAIAGGEQVSGQATLDLCNGTFPSESQRSARLQVAAYDTTGDELLSTEAVLYTDPAATAQAFSELQSVAAKCPSTPVVSPVGEPTVTTTFNPAPDAGWPQVATVTRQAYDFVSTDEQGDTEHTVAVYLRRGRVLMGVYFAQPDSPQISVAGQTTIENIVGVFAGRIARLPASVVNG